MNIQFCTDNHAEIGLKLTNKVKTIFLNHSLSSLIKCKYVISIVKALVPFFVFFCLCEYKSFKISSMVKTFNFMMQIVLYPVIVILWRRLSFCYNEEHLLNERNVIKLWRNFCLTIVMLIRTN